MRKINPELRDRLSKLITTMGYELIGCELTTQGGQTIFRLYIDKTTGVNLEDCSLVSHQVSGLLDVLDPFQGKYRLEVSSPGIDRPLFELAHFEKQLGKLVKIRLYTSIDDQRNFKGVIEHIEGDVIYLSLDKNGQTIKLPFSEIEKANLVGDIHF